MSERGAEETHQPRLGPVGWRLLASFLLVSLVSLVVLIVLSTWGVRSGLSSLEVVEHDRAATEVANDVAAAYQTAGGWDDIDLTSARAIAHGVDGRLSVFDASGTQLAGPPASSAPTSSATVVVDGARVGQVQLAFVSDVPLLVSSWSLVVGWVLASAVLGLLAAAVVGLWISGRLLRPLHRLTSAATRFAAGDHEARAGHHDLPGVLGGLSRAVDHMADSVVEHEAASRQVVADVACAVVVVGVIYAVGWAQVAIVMHLGPLPSFVAGVLPFIGPDAVKAAVAVAIAGAVRKAGVGL